MQSSALNFYNSAFKFPIVLTICKKNQRQVPNANKAKTKEVKIYHLAIYREWVRVEGEGGGLEEGVEALIGNYR